MADSDSKSKVEDDIISKYSLGKGSGYDTVSSSAVDSTNKIFTNYAINNPCKTDSLTSHDLIDIDQYYNFKNVMTPRVKIQFLYRKKATTSTEKRDDNGYKIDAYGNYSTDWKSISDYDNSKNQNNNYFVSASISDNGVKTLVLTLYDRTFYTIQDLLYDAIAAGNGNPKLFNPARADTENNNYTTIPIKDQDGNSIKGDSGIQFFRNVSKISNNIRVGYGWSEDEKSIMSDAYIKKYQPESSNDYWMKRAKDKRYRWTSRTSNMDDKSVVNTNDADNESITSSDVLSKNVSNQSTIYSGFEEFFITDVSSELTDTGIKYTITATGTENFALTGYKIVQRYMKLVSKPKKILASFMNSFNTDPYSLIRLVWADDTMPLTNGEELTFDYKTGTYIKLDEANKEEITGDTAKSLTGLKENKQLLTNLKACFSNVSNTISSCVNNMDIMYEKFITNATTDSYGNITNLIYVGNNGQTITKKTFMNNILCTMNTGGASLQSNLGQQLFLTYNYSNLNKYFKNKDKTTDQTYRSIVNEWVICSSLLAYDTSKLELSVEDSPFKSQILQAECEEATSNFVSSESEMESLVSKYNNLPYKPYKYDINYRINNSIVSDPLYGYDFYKNNIFYYIDGTEYSVYDYDQNLGNYLLAKYTGEANINDKQEVVDGLVKKYSENTKYEWFLTNTFTNLTNRYYLSTISNYSYWNKNILLNTFYSLSLSSKFTMLSLGNYIGDFFKLVNSLDTNIVNYDISISVMSVASTLLKLYNILRSNLGTDEKVKGISITSEIVDEKHVINYNEDYDQTIQDLVDALVKLYYKTVDFFSTNVFVSGYSVKNFTFDTDNRTFKKGDYITLPSVDDVYSEYEAALNSVEKELTDYGKTDGTFYNYTKTYSEKNISYNSSLTSTDSNDTDTTYIKQAAAKFIEIAKSWEIPSRKTYTYNSTTYEYGKLVGTTATSKNAIDYAFDMINNKNSANLNYGNITKYISYLDASIEKLSTEIDEVQAALNSQKESSVGKDITISFGGEESQKPNSKYFKSVSSILSEFCSQCPQHQDVSEAAASLMADGLVTYKDSNGDAQTVNVNSDNPKYNVTYGIIGYDNSNGKSVPIVGLRYKKPVKFRHIRKYCWGSGNSKMHAIKSIDIKTNSEYAMLASQSSIVKTKVSSSINKDSSNGKYEGKCYYPDGNTSFVRRVKLSEDDQNTLDGNMSTSLNSGTITVLGDPSLRFGGRVQPYSFPIYVDIKLQNENTWSTYTPYTQSFLSGYYVVSKITHSISMSGYTTTMDITRYPNLEKDL